METVDRPYWITHARTRLDVRGIAFALSAALHASLLLIILVEQPGRVGYQADPGGVAITLEARSQDRTEATASPGTAAPTTPPIVTSAAESSQTAAAGTQPRGEPAAPLENVVDESETIGESWRSITDFGTVPLPMFPPPFLSWGESVVLIMKIHVGADGRVEQVEIIRTSGFPSLDDAAIQAALTRRFPAAKPQALERKVVFFDEDAARRQPGS